VRHVSPFLDAKLLILTAWRLFKELYRYAWRCLILPTPDEIEHGFRRAVGMKSNEPVVPHVTLTSISTNANDSDPETAMVELQDAGS
jgi:hypothetical protein